MNVLGVGLKLMDWVNEPTTRQKAKTNRSEERTTHHYHLEEESLEVMQRSKSAWETKEKET